MSEENNKPTVRKSTVFYAAHLIAITLLVVFASFVGAQRGSETAMEDSAGVCMQGCAYMAEIMISINFRNDSTEALQIMCEEDCQKQYR